MTPELMSAYSSIMSRLQIKDLAVGLRVQWSKGGKIAPKILEIVAVEKRSPRGRTHIRLKDEAGVISINHNPGNRYVLAN